MLRLLLSLFTITLISSCATVQTSKNTNLEGYYVKNTEGLTEPLNYYAFERENQFKNTFALKQNTSSAKEPDFMDEMVIAIVGKPTNREYKIEITKTELVNDVLHVHYDFRYTWNDLATSIAPATLMTVSKDWDVERVNFYSSNTLRHSIDL